MWEVIRKGADILLSTPDAKRTLVWLHGLGDSADGFAPLFMQSLHLPETNVLLLTAPERPVTLNGGMEMNSWYDIKSLKGRELNSEVYESAEIITKALSDLPPQPLYLGGFSQGAAMSLFVGLQNGNLPIEAVIALSGYCFPLRVAPARYETPVFLYHGSYDDVINEENASRSYEIELRGLTNKTFTVEPRLGHSVSPTEIRALKTWLTALWAKPSI